MWMFAAILICGTALVMGTGTEVNPKIWTD